MQRCDEVRVLLRVRQFCIFLLHRRNLEVGECTAQASAQPNQPSSSRSPEFPMLHHEWGMVEEIYVFCVCAFFFRLHSVASHLALHGSDFYIFYVDFWVMIHFTN